MHRLNSHHHRLVRQGSSTISAEMARDGMKILEKYCRKKYHNSSLYDDGGGAGTADFVEPQSSQSDDRFSFDVDQGAAKLSAATVQQPLLTEPVTTDDHPASTLQPNTMDYRCCKLLKLIYHRLHIKDLLLIIVLIAYGLGGGLMFHLLEAPHEKAYVTGEQIKAQNRWNESASRLIAIVGREKCGERKNIVDKLGIVQMQSNLNNDTFSNGTATLDADCLSLFIQFFEMYEEQTLCDFHTKLPTWQWDYWNSVFYAVNPVLMAFNCMIMLKGTLFTTIGYGNMSCKTTYGRVATILYAMFGIPLMLVVLESLGRLLFHSVQKQWTQIIRCLHIRVLHRLRWRRNFLNITKIDETNVAANRSISVATTSHITVGELACSTLSVGSNDVDVFTVATFPLYLAFLIVFVYIGVCSLIFCSFERDWNYFDSFYFFFISLSTIGLGDVLPSHPHYACGFFLFFIVGLSLVSMCVSIVQTRVEERYMAALQLIDEEAIIMSSASVIDNVTNGTGVQVATQPIIRWRNNVDPRPATVNSIDLSTARQSSSGSILYHQHPAPSAVLGVLMARRRSTIRCQQQDSIGSHRRSQSVQSGSGISMDGDKPQAVEQKLSPNSITTDGDITGRSLGQPLSVITEASEEERRVIMHHQTVVADDTAPPSD